MGMSGLQKEVLQLYRQFQRTAHQRNMGMQTREFVRMEFERNKNISVRDVSTIEYLLRRGRGQLEWFQKMDVGNVQHWNPS
jgi:succinate dehydrogenase assembly factor 1